MSTICEYFFSLPSPWAYLGHARLGELAQRHGVRIKLKPCDLGKVFDVSGGLPVSKRPPQRQAYRLLELKRWSEHLQIPLVPQPKSLPVSNDPAATLIIATQFAHGATAAFAVAGAILRALWAEDRNIADEATLAAIADACGHDGRALLDASRTAAVKAEYERNTQEAISKNVFGSPWYIVDGEAFWGQDRLDFVERAFASRAGN